MAEQASPIAPRKPRGTPIQRGEEKSRAPRGPKPDTKRASYKELPWAQIRQDFENTDIATIALCRQYGIASDNTLRKRIAAEGWTKNVDAITAGLVQAGLVAQAGDPLTPVFPKVEDLVERGQMITIEGATDAELLDEAPPSTLGPAPVAVARPLLRPEEFAAAVGPIVTAGEAERLAAERAARPKSAKPKKAQLQQEVDDRTRAHHGDDDRHEGVEPPPDPPPQPSAKKSAEVSPPQPIPAGDPAEIKNQLARGLAGLHIQANAEQLVNAQRMKLVGNLMLARIMTALSVPNDPEGVEARNALMAINAERETLAGLLKATSDLMERAATMERRVLGMDPKAGPQGPIAATSLQPYGGGPVRSSSEVAKLAQGLPPDILMSLRQAAVAVAKLPPAQRPGLTPEPEPEGVGEGI